MDDTLSRNKIHNVLYILRFANRVVKRFVRPLIYQVQHLSLDNLVFLLHRL